MIKKKILGCLTCVLLFTTILSFAQSTQGNENTTDTGFRATTLTFQGHWWADPNGTGPRHVYYEKDGKITITVTTLGLGKIIGIGTLNGTWSTADEAESGSLTGRLFYRMASFLYRGDHGFFIGTMTYDSDGSSEPILGDLTAFGPENYWGSYWRTPSISIGWAKGKSPSS